MTLSELGNALRRIGLDIDTKQGKNILDRILILFGENILKYKKKRCEYCWLKKNKGCSDTCELYGSIDDPLMMAKLYLVSPNDVNLMSFIFEFVIPVYEQDTGNTGTIESIKKEFAKRMKREFGNTGTRI